MRTYQWLLFDADNTLLDYNRAEQYALGNALSDYGLSLTEHMLDQYRRINKSCWDALEAGRIDRETLRYLRFQAFFQSIAVDVDPVSFSRQYTGRLSEAGFLIEGATEVLDHLGAHYPMGLVTNGLAEIQRPRLQAAGLNAYFDLIVISDEIGYYKPQSGFFEHTRQALSGPAPDQVLVIGDNLNADIRGAQDFGWHACWYNPRQQANGFSVQPTFEIQSLAELPPML